MIVLIILFLGLTKTLTLGTLFVIKIDNTRTYFIKVYWKAFISINVVKKWISLQDFKTVPIVAANLKGVSSPKKHNRKLKHQKFLVPRRQPGVFLQHDSFWDLWRVFVIQK